MQDFIEIHTIIKKEIQLAFYKKKKKILKSIQ